MIEGDALFDPGNRLIAALDVATEAQADALIAALVGCRVSSSLGSNCSAALARR